MARGIPSFPTFHRSANAYRKLVDYTSLGETRGLACGGQSRSDGLRDEDNLLSPHL